MQSQKKICFCFLFLNANLKKPTQQKPSAGVEAGPETEPPEHVSGETLSFGETLSLVAAGLGDHLAPARQRGRAQRAATRDHFRDGSPSSREQEERCMRPGPGRSAAAQAVAGRDRRVPPCGPVSPPGDGSRRGLIPTFGTGSRHQQERLARLSTRHRLRDARLVSRSRHHRTHPHRAPCPARGRGTGSVHSSITQVPHPRMEGEAGARRQDEAETDAPVAGRARRPGRGGGSASADRAPRRCRGRRPQTRGQAPRR